MTPLFRISRRNGLLLLLWLLPVLGVVWSAVQAPVWLEPQRLRIALEPGQSLTLGRETLAAAHADSEHLRISRTVDGGWRLANLSPGKQVLWQSRRWGEERSTREWPLTPGAAFAIGAQRFDTVQVAPGRLVLQNQGQRWEYDGFNLRLDGRSLPECYPHWRALLRERLADWLGALHGWRRPLRLGGGVYCADRLGLAGVPIDAALLSADSAGFVLRPGPAGRTDSVLIQVALGQPEAEALWQRAIPLSVGDGLIIGRTRYRVAQTEPTLELTIITRAWRWPANAQAPSLPPGVRIESRPASLLWPASIAGLEGVLGLGLAALLLTRWPGAGTLVAALALAGASLSLYEQRLTAPILWSYALAWAGLGLWLITVRSRWSAGLLATLTLLLGIGLIAGLQLAVGAAESGWSQYGGGGAALAGTFAWLTWAGWRWRRLHPAAGSLSRWIPWAAGLLGGAATGLLLAQTLWGDESGWRGFQPFELTKLALVVAAAYGLAARWPDWESPTCFGTLWRWLRYLGPVALLIVVSSFALTFLRDFSPLLLLAIWLIGVLWAWAGLHPQARRLGRLSVLALIGAALAGLALLRAQPESFPLNIQAERIRVWAAPEQYPHAGYQLRRALEAIRAGGWPGAVWSDPGNGWLMNLPAVEDDFMPAFLLNRYGGATALALAGIQTAFIGLLLNIGKRAARRDPPHPQHAWIAPGRFAYFTLYGGAALLAAHFLVSWGANLGLLPVMGQPMSLLSNAGSHLTLFALPIVALAVALEEKQHGDPS